MIEQILLKSPKRSLIVVFPIVISEKLAWEFYYSQRIRI